MVEPIEDPASAPTAGRVPVLAIGSNAAPSQLRRKFAHPDFGDPASPDALIPVIAASLRDIDVVHAAHVALYGSIPATVVRAPGRCAAVHITWLTAGQLRRMDRSEGLGLRHHACRLSGASSAGSVVDSTWCYASIAGALTVDGRPVGLAAVRVDGSDLPRATQVGIWELLAAASGLADDGPALLAAVVADDGVRRSVAAFLAAAAVPDGLEEHRIIGRL